MDPNPWRSCRGCLLEGSGSKMFSLAIPETRILFYECTSILVPDAEELSAQICFHCYKECEKWRSFKRMCEETEDRLQQKPSFLDLLPNINLSPCDVPIEDEDKLDVPICQMPLKVEKVDKDAEEEEKHEVLPLERRYLWNPLGSVPDDDKESIAYIEENSETLYPNPFAGPLWGSSEEPEIEFISTVKIEVEDIIPEREYRECEDDHLDISNSTQTDNELVESTAVEWLPHLEPEPEDDIESIPLSLRRKKLLLNGYKKKKKRKKGSRWKDGNDKPDSLTNGGGGVVKKKRGRRKKQVVEDPLVIQRDREMAPVKSPEPPPPTSGRKRGRPRKTEKEKDPDYVSDYVNKVKPRHPLKDDPTWRDYSDANNWDCPNCHLRFHDEKSLRCHFRDELTDQCKICEARVKVPASLIPHIIRAHMRKWDCQKCPARLDSSLSFSMHMLMNHKKGPRSKDERDKIKKWNKKMKMKLTEEDEIDF